MHENGVVHRDMNPTNVFVNFQAQEQVQVKILDFNVSKLVSGQKDINKNNL
jgi:serine/threonine protein kinase